MVAIIFYTLLENLSSSSSPPLSDFGIRVRGPCIFFIHSYSYALKTTISNNTILTSSIPLADHCLLSLQFTGSSSFIANFQPSLGLQCPDFSFCHYSPTLLPLPLVFTSHYVQRKFHRPCSLEKNLILLMYSPVKNLTLVKANYLPFPVGKKT